MLKLFFNRGRGSVTVFVTLIMIPTIFFTAFLGDLARIKLYGNIALMTADNYAESILTEYDDLLRELYGFFSVSQNKEAKDAVELLMDYSKTSFNPNEKTINYQYLQAVTGKKSYDGFAPYSNANVELSYKPVADSSLSNDEVFATQMGDFMRFRIAQQLLMSGDMKDDEVGNDLLDIQKKVEERENDMKAIDKQQEFAKELQEYLDLLANYYDCLRLIEECYDSYRYDYYQCHQAVIDEYDEFLNSDEYKEYYEYKHNEVEINKALWERDQHGEEDLTEEQKHLCEIGDNFKDNDKYVDDFCYAKGTFATKNSAKTTYVVFHDSKEYKIDDTIWVGQGHKVNEDHHINISKYKDCIVALGLLANKIEPERSDVIRTRNELQAIVNEKNGKDFKVSEELRTSINDHIKKVNEFIGTDDNNKTEIQNPKIYEEIVNYYYKDPSNTYTNDRYKVHCDAEMQAFVNVDDQIKNAIIEPKDDMKVEDLDVYKDAFKNIDIAEKLNFKSIMTVESYKKLYEQLAEGYKYDGDIEKNKKGADDKKKDANDKVKQADEDVEKQKDKDKEDAKKVRSIPKSYDFGKPGEEKSSNLKDMMKTIGNTVSSGDWGNAGNKALLKVYTIEYDFGMFSSRITEKTKEKEKNNKDEDEGFVGNVVDNATSTSTVTLTGYEKCRSINYLYGGELEYIIHGDKNSQSNLNYTRNIICGFRMIMNFGSSYSISEVNKAIQGISKVFEAIPYVGPAVAIAVEIALRFGFAAMETALEWQRLMEGGKVILYKTKVEELQCLEDLKGWLEGDDSKDLKNAKSDNNDKVGLTYEQYLLIMLMFMTSAENTFDRTRNLIELNVNAVQNKVGEDGSLDSDYNKLNFKMSNTYTAVEATCSVQTDFAIIPKGFAKMFLDENPSDNGKGVSYSELEEFEKTRYKYSIIRGY